MSLLTPSSIAQSRLFRAYRRQVLFKQIMRKSCRCTGETANDIAFSACADSGCSLACTSKVLLLLSTGSRLQLTIPPTISYCRKCQISPPWYLGYARKGKMVFILIFMYARRHAELNKGMLGRSTRIWILMKRSGYTWRRF